MLQITKMTLGPVATNCYLVSDPEVNSVVVIDPAWAGDHIRDVIREGGWRLAGVWLTHAHFDHYGGAAELLEAFPGEDRKIPYGLHPGDFPLWKIKGGASAFGVEFDRGPRPDLEFAEGQQLSLGKYAFQVLHAPGHSPGHVMFYCPDASALFSGDVIFQRGIGRTDLRGGDHRTLIDTIRNQVLPLPEDTRIFPGHGPETTVEEERRGNPFL